MIVHDFPRFFFPTENTSISSTQPLSAMASAAQVSKDGMGMRGQRYSNPLVN